VNVIFSAISATLFAILPAIISNGEAPLVACGTAGVCFATCAVLLNGARFAGTALLAVLPAGALTVDTAIVGLMIIVIVLH
jgi:hypothetical protein